MSKKKIIIAVGIVIVLLAGVIAGIFLVRRRQEIRVGAEPATTLRMVSDNPNPTVDETFTVDVVINSNENSIVGVDLDITYPPELVSALSVEPGTFFANPTPSSPQIDTTQGSLTYSIDSDTPVTDTEGVLATITFRAEGSGSATLDFGPGTVVNAVDQTGLLNALASSSPAVVVIGFTETTTPSPTAIATGSPSPAPTEDGQIGIESSPTGSPSPTPTDDSSGSVGGLEDGDSTATPSATPTSTATSSATPIPSTLPDTAFGIPTLGLFGGGILVVLASLFLFAF